MKRVVVIGAGPAGLMSAIAAADNGSTVTVIEKNDRPARKLMITGKGRCNLTNNCDVDTLIANIPVNAKFLYSAFSNFTPSNTISFFEKCGVRLKTERGNRVFPVSDKAVDIVDALVNKARSSGVKIINATVDDITVTDNTVTGVKLSDGEEIFADALILATGGRSYPITGSTGDGYRMSEKLGHTIKPTVPSLIPLVCHEGFCSKLAGLSLKNVTFSVYENQKKKPIFSQMGEMLFTHFGVSGPLVLSASAHIKYLDKKKYTAYIDLKPALEFEQLDSRILRDFSQEQNKDFINSLDKLLPKSLIPVVVTLSGVNPHTKINQISKDDRQKLCKIIKALPLNIVGFRPIEEAIITRGGVSVKEINPTTMQSKIVNGLYFAGEIIDVDAYTGGFNLQIAFSTGYTAGISV